MFTSTTATEKLLALRKRIRGIAGGTSASKTISILLILIDKALTNNNLTISVVSESFPHLYRGAIKDFVNIMQEQNYFREARWNKTHSTYTFETDSIIEFFSVDQPHKVRGPRRDILFINEANNIPGGYDTYTQLEIRTKDVIWLDWNPSSEFWFYTDVLPYVDCDFITLTYKDNESLAPSIVQSIEAKQHNANWWKVYGLGQLGELEGKIFNGWRIVDSVPLKARYEGSWLDFGYTNDPTAAGSAYYLNGWYILDELIYNTGLLNPDIAKLLKPQIPKDGLIIADAAEPKSIAELILYGLTVIGATKGKDSIINGIQVVQGLKIAVTKRSVNLLKEYRNWMWLVDRLTGKPLNVPSPIWNHHMDGIRYLFSYLEPFLGTQTLGQVGPQPREVIPTFSDELGSLGDALAEAEEEVGRVTTRSQL